LAWSSAYDIGCLLEGAMQEPAAVVETTEEPEAPATGLRILDAGVVVPGHRPAAPPAGLDPSGPQLRATQCFGPRSKIAAAGRRARSTSRPTAPADRQAATTRRHVGRPDGAGRFAPATASRADGLPGRSPAGGSGTRLPAARRDQPRAEHRPATQPAAEPLDQRGQLAAPRARGVGKKVPPAGAGRGSWATPRPRRPTRPRQRNPLQLQADQPEQVPGRRAGLKQPDAQFHRPVRGHSSRHRSPRAPRRPSDNMPATRAISRFEYHLGRVRAARSDIPARAGPRIAAAPREARIGSGNRPIAWSQRFHQRAAEAGRQLRAGERRRWPIVRTPKACNKLDGLPRQTQSFDRQRA